MADEFGLSPIQKCSAQHTAFLDGNYITVFDNGDRNGASCVVGYCIDPEEKKLKPFRSYTLGGMHSEVCGSVQHLDDEVYVIGWGMSMAIRRLCPWWISPQVKRCCPCASGIL